MLEHISETLVKELDAAVGGAIRLVDEAGAEQATVSLAFTVGLDKDERLTVAYQIKDGRKRGGEWRPSLAPRLPFGDGDDRSVSFGVDGKPPVETPVGMMKRALDVVKGRAATGI